MINIYDKAEHGRLVSAREDKEAMRSEAVKKMHDMHDAGESKAWDAPQHLEYNQLKAKAELLKSDVAEIDARINQYEKIQPVEPKAKKAKIEQDALSRWCEKGDNGLEAWEIAEQRNYLQEVGASEDPGTRKYMVAWDGFNNTPLSPGDSGSGNVGQEEVVPTVVRGLKDFGGAWNAVTVARTSHGNELRYPISDETAATAQTGNTSGKSGNTDDQGYLTHQDEGAINTLTERTFYAKLFNTKFTDVSRFQAEDVAWDVGAFVRDELMRRMGRTLEAQLMTGAGGNINMTGIQTRAAETVTKKAVGSMKWEDIITLVHAVDPAYISGERGMYGLEHRPGRIGFLTSWAYKGVLSMLQDGQNRPIMLPSMSMGSYDTMYGYPVMISQEITDKADANNARPLIFGNFGYHVLRLAGRGLMIEQHYDSATALRNTWRFMGRLRADSDVITPFVDTSKTPAYRIAKIRAA